ncbi:MAG: metal ABC transporter permease [Candidatus Humimicrobiaceae bacterium]
MIEILRYGFMQNALIAAFLVSIACAIVGTYVVVRKIIFISGGISHAAFGGIGLGYLLGINPIAAAIPFSLAFAIIFGLFRKKLKISEDSAVGILWVTGMALGILFISLAPGYAPDLFSYLFGNILTVSTTDIIIISVLDIVIIITSILLGREFVYISFDEEFSWTLGIPVKFIYVILLCLVSLNVVVLIRVVGIIMVIALLSIPATIAKQFTYNIKKIMVLSAAIGIAVTVSGLFISYYFDLSSGAVIIILLIIVFLLSYVLKYLISSLKKHNQEKLINS